MIKIYVTGANNTNQIIDIFKEMSKGENLHFESHESLSKEIKDDSCITIKQII